MTNQCPITLRVARNLEESSKHLLTNHDYPYAKWVFYNQLKLGVPGNYGIPLNISIRIDWSMENELTNQRDVSSLNTELMEGNSPYINNWHDIWPP